MGLMTWVDSLLSSPTESIDGRIVRMALYLHFTRNEYYDMTLRELENTEETMDYLLKRMQSG